MKIRNILLTVVLFCIVAQANGQDFDEQAIVNAMSGELIRNMEGLELPDYPRPFYISYAFGKTSYVKMQASLGSVLSVSSQPASNTGAVRMLVGDYHRSSDITYDGRPLIALTMPADYEPGMIGRNYWIGADIAYKTALNYYVQKINFLQENPRNGRMDKLDDFDHSAVTSGKWSDYRGMNIDIEQWKQNIREVSAVFKDYPFIENSLVDLQWLDYTVYTVTSDGVASKSPVPMVSLVVNGTVVAEDGTKISDHLVILGLTLEDLPSLSEIKQQVSRFAEKLEMLRMTSGFEDYYRGPVMFEDAAATQVFMSNTISPRGLLAFRAQEGSRIEDTLDERIGQAIMDDRITVKNYSAKSEYNGKKLYGSYDIDAEGVTPPAEITLVEKGKLKALLNGRIPTPGAPQSTGSSRWTINNQSLAFVTSPGTLHFQINGGIKPDDVKKQLLKLAKGGKQDYAYIVRRISGAASLIYRVDVKTGNEILVRGGALEDITLKKMRKLGAISNIEAVSNMGTKSQTIISIICPTSFIIDDVEITKDIVVKQNASPLTFPLRRN